MMAYSEAFQAYDYVFQWYFREKRKPGPALYSALLERAAAMIHNQDNEAPTNVELAYAVRRAQAGLPVEDGQKLSDRKLKILRALKKLRATSRDRRKQTSEIRVLVDPATSLEALAHPLRELRKRGYIASTGSGRSGGYWITTEGVERIKT